MEILNKKIIFGFLFLFPSCLFGQHINQNSLNNPRNSLVEYLTPRTLTTEVEVDFEPELSSLDLSVDIVLRPEDFTAGNFLSPRATGNYSDLLWGIKDNDPQTFRGMYDINLDIQAPTTTNDASATVNRILSSGGVGNLNASLKIGFFEKDNSRGITLSISPSFSWQNSKQLIETNSDSFAFFSIKSSITAWGGPMLITVQAAQNNILGNNLENIIAMDIDNSFVITTMAALKLNEDFYFQVKALVSESSFNNEMIEIGIVRTIGL
ncbi:MAG: hypothetical protein JJU13_21485 [Balneolaceae bacterium]|nr:hypothetical protein [Balneolaceae bacterium]